MSKKRRFCELAIMVMLFVVVVFIIKPAEALTIETYTDRPAWESALSDIYQEDFNSFSEYCGIPSFPNYKDVGVSFKLQELSNNPWSKNTITPKTECGLDIDGSSYIYGRVEKKSIEGTEHTTRLNMIFDDHPIMAFGADYRNVNNGAGIDFFLTQKDNYSDGELLSGKDLMNNDGFFGFIVKEAPKGFSAILLQASGRLVRDRALLTEGFGMDNIKFVKAGDVTPRYKEPANSVPEPCTIFLLGSLLIFFGIFKKRSE